MPMSGPASATIAAVTWRPAPPWRDRRAVVFGHQRDPAFLGIPDQLAGALA